MSSLAPIPLEPGIRRYAWGDPAFLPEMFGLARSGVPCAEAWFGDHPIAPATARLDGVDRPLDRLLADRAEIVLGAEVRARYGGMPYLLKLLAAGSPLSIQVHPARAEAEAGFARESALGLRLDAPERCYRDPRAKSELLVALTPVEALCGFRPADGLARALDDAPEIRALLPVRALDPAGLRDLLGAYFALPPRRLGPPLARWLARLSEQAARGAYGPEDPAWWVLRARQGGPLGEPPDRGLFLAALLAPVRLRPGQGVFLPAGVPHTYLRGAGVELMTNSDNVLRAGLTRKHVAPEELLRVVRFDAGAPPIVDPIERGVEATYPVPGTELALRRIRLGSADRLIRVASGPETLLALPDAPGATVLVSCGGQRLSLGRGAACLLPHGARYTVEAQGGAVLFCAGASPIACADSGPPVAAILRTLAATESLFASGEPAAIVGAVSGSEAARAAWQQRLDAVRPLLRAREAVSLHEDLPVNQAFGLLLLWKRLRPRLRPGEGALVALVFGEGSRAAPLTEAECGQKPAILSFASAGSGAGRRPLSMAELALRTFAPIEAHLRRSGFDGVVVKWGDELQVPSVDLAGADPRFAGADVVRFVSVREITAEDAESKDWIGVDAEGRVTAFVPRRPLAQMEALAARGLVQRRDGRLYGGINLGSVALSRALLDELLSTFETEVDDPRADRRRRPDLDPQLFTALTIAAIGEAAPRERAWADALRESASIRRLEADLPCVLARLRGALDRFEARWGRPVRMVALDLGEPYWGDIGEHRRMFDLYASLRERGPEGEIARALAGLPSERDADGNILAGRTRLGPGVRVRGSVLVDVHVDAGEIVDSVLVGTRCGTLRAHGAFDVHSTAVAMTLGPRAGAYRVVCEHPVEVGRGERLTTVFLPEGPLQVRGSEEIDLRDRASSYDVPILGNALSFCELHERVCGADPSRSEAAREQRRREVAAALDAPEAGSR